MKIRNGFVSNSSSSSFMIGAAKIVDEEKAMQFLATCGYGPEDNELTSYGLAIYTTKQLLSKERMVGYHDIHEDTKSAAYYVESFRGDKASVKIDPDKNEKFLFLCAEDNEGDCGRFSGEYGDINYDIDLDYFTDNEQKIYAAIENGENGLAKGEAIFGAGRNG